MTIPHLTQEQLLQLLSENGWVEVSNRDWDTHNRIMIGKGKDSFPLQLKPVYYYLQIVKLCESIEITPPEDCQHCYDQQMQLKRRSNGK